MRLLYPAPYRELAARGPLPVQRIPVAGGPTRWADLRIPSGDGPHPVVVLLHGGFWKRAWAADLMNSLAVALTSAGFATWNLEYPRVGMRGGGWPGTADAVVAGVDALAEGGPSLRLDATRVVLVGHSAGGHLALVAAARATVRPRGVVALAAVSDLRSAHAAGLGGDAAGALMGSTPEADPAAWTAASPIERVPLDVPALLLHGTRDQAVPPSMSTLYAQRANAAGDDVEVQTLRGIGHAELIDPTSPAFPIARDWIEAHLDARSSLGIGS